MKPFTKLAEARTPDGTLFTLNEHDGEFYLQDDGHDLMSTALTYSEQLLADIGCDFKKRPKRPRILIGGLGLGYSLKRVLELMPPSATVEVAEIVPEVVEWNRTFLAAHNGPLLDDPRTVIRQADVYDCLADPGSGYHAILLDVDDSPGSLVLPQNKRLYTREGLQMIQQALAPQGRVVFWLAAESPRFYKDLTRAGFRTTKFPAKMHERSRQERHRIYLAEH